MIETRKKTSAKHTYLVLIFISCYSLIFADYWKYWNDNQTPFRADAAISYWYVPATFINHDYKKPQERNMQVFADSAGHTIPKYTYGMAVMYTPFFFIGHKLSINANEKLDGYSLGYCKAIHYGCIIYGLLGLLFLSFILRKYFNDIISAVTLLLIFFGTNLMVYVLLDSERVHSSLFFLISLFIWLTIKWHDNPTIKKSIFIGLIAGLIIMIRPTDGIIVFLFLLYGIKNYADVKNKIKLFFSIKWHTVTILFSGFLMIIPQLIFWKVYTGEFFYYGYGTEHFFWSDPALSKFLFSYCNGWFVYTPIMFFAFIGLFMMKKNIPDFQFGSIVYIILNIYILSSWWCWWYMGYGNRSAIESYPVMALALAAIITRVTQIKLRFSIIHHFIKCVLVLCFSFLIYLNVLQSYQYKTFLLPYQGMNEKTYWMIFCRFYLNPEEQQEFTKSLTNVNWSEAIEGKGR